MLICLQEPIWLIYPEAGGCRSWIIAVSLLCSENLLRGFSCSAVLEDLFPGGCFFFFLCFVISPPRLSDWQYIIAILLRNSLVSSRASAPARCGAECIKSETRTGYSLGLCLIPVSFCPQGLKCSVCRADDPYSMSRQHTEKRLPL